MQEVKLLEEVKWDKQFEYEIKKLGKLYVAGIRKVKLNSDVRLSGRIFLDELSKGPEENRVTKYLYNVERRTTLFSIDSIVIDKDFDQFIKNIRTGLLKKRQKMNVMNIDYFFRRVYDHYNVFP